jgi:Tol biopolymer transport system component
VATYAEFRLRIEPGPTPGTYRVEASGIAGEDQGEFVVPFTDTELENFVLKVGRTRRGVRRIESPEMQMARAFGGTLFSAVMHDRVGALYRSAIGEARALGQGLRITLALTDAPELGGIPWEYLYDDPNFLAISSDTPVVRYLDLPKPRRALELTLPLRILAVVSAPSDAEQLDAALEKSRLEEAIRPLLKSGAVTIDWLEEPNLLALSRKMRDDTYHILHYVGHGGFDDTTGEGALLFEDEAGRGSVVSGDKLATVLQDKRNLRLVLLNSCEGARNAVKDPFSGVATSLVEREVPAVIGMQFEITDRAAIIFAGEFYATLAEGKSVDAALASARLAIFADNNDVEWATPVLFMRIADGQLFNVTGGATPTMGGRVAWQRIARAFGNTRLPWRWIAGVGAIVSVLLIALVALLPRAPATTGSLDVNARGTHETGTVVVTGTDFEPGETVNILLDGLYVLSAVASDDGTFTTEVPVTGQTGEVSVEGRSSGNTASAEFAVLPTASGPPSSGSAPPSGTAPPSASGGVGPPVADSPGILFYSDHSDEDDGTDYELYLIDPETRKVEQLTHNDVNDRFPTWSPGYTHIAFESKVDGSRDILTSPLRGLPTPLTSGSPNDIFPAWSQDDWIAYVRDDQFIRKVLSDGAGGATLVDGFRVGAPAWSSDGSRLAFMSSNPGLAFNLNIVNADGTGLERLTTAPTSERNPNWSPDDSTLVFVMDQGEEGEGDNDIYLFDMATRTVTDRLTDNEVQDGNPVWSPDGTQIAFYRKSTDGFQIWTMNADGTNQENLMKGRRGWNLDPMWR